MTSILALGQYAGCFHGRNGGQGNKAMGGTKVRGHCRMKEKRTKVNAKARQISPKIQTTRIAWCFYVLI